MENKLEEKKEQEFINRNYNDEDEAPIQYYENKNNNNINNNINQNNNCNNIYNDDVKTLTNDENVYFASRTDKLLYKPYSNEEINNK